MSEQESNKPKTVSDNTPRKIIVPQSSRPNLVSVTRVNSVSSMLDGALSVLGEQLDKIALKSRSSTFTEKEARVLQGYIKSLVELSKEEREREKADKLNEELANMTDAELLELAKQKLEETKDKK